MTEGVPLKEVKGCQTPEFLLPVPDELLALRHLLLQRDIAFVRTMRLLRFGLDSLGPRVKINLLLSKQSVPGIWS